MRFLANENFPGDAVSALREDGHDLAWVLIDAPGSPDGDVLARTVHENRILLTFDKDFGELAWRAGLPANAGIVLFRIPMPSSVDVGQAISSIIRSREDWAGHFSVVEPGRIRMRPLPLKR